MAINNSIFNILDSSTTTNSFQKISNNSEEFFSRFISINNFTRVMKELCRIVTEILKINRHCINEDQEISKMYGRTFNIMLYNVGF